jgi:acyl-CoA synthetase (AMP-forming)/AMP-acid ligase II
MTDTDFLARRPANHQPLTPIFYLERAAKTHPEALAIVHGDQRVSYADFYARSRRLASALAARGVRAGDTVATLLLNTPPQLEAHYGVPMLGATLNAINTRLDAAGVAFILDHGEAKALIVDSELAPMAREALETASVKPMLIEYADPTVDLPRVFEDSAVDYEAFLETGDAGFDWTIRRRRMGLDRAQLHLRHDRRPQGRALSPPRRGAAGDGQCDPCGDGARLGLSLDAADVPLQRLVLPLDAVDRRRDACLPALCPRQGDV